MEICQTDGCQNEATEDLIVFGAKMGRVCHECNVALEEKMAEPWKMREAISRAIEVLGDDEIARKIKEHKDPTGFLLFSISEIVHNKKYPDAIEFSFALFSALGSTGPNHSSKQNPEIRSFWDTGIEDEERQMLVLVIHDENKGRWIGKGGTYVRNAKELLNRIGCEFELVA